MNINQDENKRQLDLFVNQWFDSSDYIEANTSGSTGTPKPIKLLKSDMRCSARATNAFFGITEQSVLGLPLAMSYIAGKMMAVRAIEAGCRLELLPVSNRIVVGSHVDLLAIVPSQALSLVEDNEPACTSNVIVGGAPMSAPQRALLQTLPANVYATYGMTETCSHVALSHIDEPALIYTALPGITFATDPRECLRIDAPAMSFGSLQTNDVVTLIDSRHFIWRGRADNIINSGGRKIVVEQLEQAIAGHLTQPFYIRGRADDKWGTAVELVVEGQADIDAIDAQLSKLNLGFQHPKFITVVEQLPRTANGKLRRS